jgi:hypothetical protein
MINEADHMRLGILHEFVIGYSLEDTACPVLEIIEMVAEKGIPRAGPEILDVPEELRSRGRRQFVLPEVEIDGSAIELLLKLQDLGISFAEFILGRH